MIQTEGFEATRAVDPNMVIKKKDGKDQEIQEGWKGRILPFEMVQSRFLTQALNDLGIDEERVAEISAEYTELLDALSEDDKQKLLNDDDTAFVPKEIAIAFKEIMDGLSTSETKVLEAYLTLSKAKEKSDFVLEHPEIHWSRMTQSKNGTYSKAEINKYIKALKAQIHFEEGTYEYIVSRVNSLIVEEKSLKKEVKEKADRLHLETKETIENLSDKQVIMLLKDKWITPLIENLMKLPESIVSELVAKIETLAKKYDGTLSEIESEIEETQKQLSAMIDDLEGNKFDMLGLGELKKLLGGE
jgi:hypothetical protein